MPLPEKLAHTRILDCPTSEISERISVDVKQHMVERWFDDDGEQVEIWRKPCRWNKMTDDDEIRVEVRKERAVRKPVGGVYAVQCWDLIDSQVFICKPSELFVWCAKVNSGEIYNTELLGEERWSIHEWAQD